MIGAVFSTLLFLACLGLIFSEKLNRTIVAFAGATLMVGLGIMFGFYSDAQAIAAIASIGQHYGVSVRGMDSIIRLACIVHRTDYWRRGRTVENSASVG